MRTIKQIHPARYSPIEDLITYSPLPSAYTKQIDPFLMLNHHGPQRYIRDNNGLPFIPHPYRGIDTVIFVLKGDLLHRDTLGNESVIKEGGVQWMTTGCGLIHAENSSEEFKEHGGYLELLQLWINLPSKHKMIPPRYINLQKNEIPAIRTDHGRTIIRLISGTMDHHKGVVETVSDVTMAMISFKPQGRLTLAILKEYNIFFYVVSGTLQVNDRLVNSLNLVEFNMDHGEHLDIAAVKESMLLLGYAKPLQEPIVAEGPFVMNNQQEIQQAYKDFYRGRMGRWS